MSKRLTEVLIEQGIDLQPSSNGRWIAVCPFHEGDRDPSFTIYTHNDSYYCFGCQAWGDPVKFLIDYKGMTSKEAQENVGIDYEQKKEEKLKVIKTRNTLLTWELLFRVSRAYHTHLLNTPGALNYLRGRGLSDDTIRSNVLGYTDGRVLRFEYAEDYKLAVEAGLLNRDGFEIMSHRITIPNINSWPKKTGADFIIGRTVINDKIKYLGTKLTKPIYGFAEYHKSPILFLAEGQFDWLLLKQWGYPTVVLSGSHLPRYHLMTLKEKMVIIVPDNDTIGLQTAQKLHNSLINSFILDYSILGYKDVGDLGADKKETGKYLFEQALREQEWYNTLSLKDHWMKWLPNSLATGYSP